MSNDPRQTAARGATPEGLRERAQRFDRAHPAPPAPKAPDPGHVLAMIDRTDGTQFRVSLHTYEGRPFVRLAPWRNGWPIAGKGCTVKVRELAAVAEGLAAAMDAIDREGAR